MYINTYCEKNIIEVINVQKIKCSVLECKYCDCEKQKCKLNEITVCNCECNEPKLKEETMCNSYKRRK